MNPRLAIVIFIVAFLSHFILASLSQDELGSEEPQNKILSLQLDQTPHSNCLEASNAEQEAMSLALNWVQNCCRSAGFGWRAAHITNHGQLDCENCGNGSVICGYSKLSLECDKRHSKLSWKDWVGQKLDSR